MFYGHFLIAGRLDLRLKWRLWCWQMSAFRRSKGSNNLPKVISAWIHGRRAEDCTPYLSWRKSLLAVNPDG